MTGGWDPGSSFLCSRGSGPTGKFIEGGEREAGASAWLWRTNGTTYYQEGGSVRYAEAKFFNVVQKREDWLATGQAEAYRAGL